jgi:enoyl-CoA hydratase/carnithine racemase
VALPPTFIDVDRPHEGVARLVLRRADKRNALSIALRDEISDALGALALDETLKALVVTGDGTTFSAGFDLGEFETAMSDADFATTLWASSDRYHRAIATFPLPTIAAVNGPALGGGFDLAVLCDLRVAAETARFAHPEYAFGDVVYAPLADLVGGAWARELCITGRALDAAEALAIHLVNRVVPASDLQSAALELARTVAVAPRANLIRTKAKALRRGALPDGGTLDL